MRRGRKLTPRALLASSSIWTRFGGEAGHSPLAEDGARIMAEVKRARPTIWATLTALQGINMDVGLAIEMALGALPEGSKAWLDLTGRCRRSPTSRAS